jgi:predicted nucleic acid-binding protein
MTTLLDTSVIVRYLIDDPPEQAARAAELRFHASHFSSPGGRDRPG